MVHGMVSVVVITLLGIPGIPRTVGIIQPLMLFFLIASLGLFMAVWLGEGFRMSFEAMPAAM